MNALRTYGRPFLLLLLLLAGTVFSCAGSALVAVPSRQAPLFTDDSPFASLKEAIRINLDYLARQPAGKSVRIAGKVVPMTRLIRSHQVFLDILEQNPSPTELDRLVKEKFDVFQTGGTRDGNSGRNMLVTGYYQPVFTGSLTRQAPFLYPLYGIPEDLIQRSGNTKGPIFGRRENGCVVPYWTRAEIEKQQRAAGHELVWLRDPFDAFLVHIQGSAIIQFPDGSRRGIHYAAKNGHPYRSIGSHLVHTGRLTRKQTTMQSIRDYIAAHPAECDEILHANPSFIFFAWTETAAVIGSLGTELTAGRSVAADHDHLPPGALAFLISRRPTVAHDNSVHWTPLHRFVVVQDSGSAINGSGRVDLFWGTGPEAGAEAGLMKEDGTLYFFLAKEKGATPLPDRETTGGGKGS